MGNIRDVYEITTEVTAKIKKFLDDKQEQRKELGFKEYFGIYWKIILSKKGTDFTVVVSAPRCPVCKTELQEDVDSDECGYDRWEVYDCPNPECGKISRERFDYPLYEIQERISKTEHRKIEEKLENTK